MTLDYRYQDLKPLRQKTGSQYIPQPQQIQEYASYIGIVLPQQKYMIQLAVEGVIAPLPSQWQACQTSDGQLVYRNTKTKNIQFQHPLDQLYKQKVIQFRKYYEQTLLQNQNEELHTITEGQSQEGSSISENKDEIAKIMLQPTNTLKQQDADKINKISLVPKEQYLQQNIQKQLQQFEKASKYPNSSQMNKQKQKILKSKKLQQKRKLEQKQKERTRLREELAKITKQQNRALQLLKQLQSGNSRRIIELKGLMKQKIIIK